MMTLREILQDIHGLDLRLQELEQKYGLLSADMYTLYRLGEFEQSRDLIRWVGYYELRQDRQRSYEKAPDISFDKPNLPFLIQEIEQAIQPDAA